MIEKISDPLAQLQQLLDRDLGSYFRIDGGNLVAGGETEDGLAAQVTLHPDHGNWMLFLGKQREKEYKRIVIDDIMSFSANKKAAARIRDFLSMHRIRLTKADQ